MPVSSWTLSAAPPAGHSPVAAPDGRFVLAAATASRSEHSPSSATTSACVVTAMSVAFAGVASASGVSTATRNPMRRVMTAIIRTYAV